MNKRVKSYLEKVGVKTVRELTDTQVISYYLDESKHTEPMFYAEMAFRKFERGKVISSMRKSMEENIEFICTRIYDEHVGDYIPKESGWILRP